MNNIENKISNFSKSISIILRIAEVLTFLIIILSLTSIIITNIGDNQLKESFFKLFTINTSGSTISLFDYSNNILILFYVILNSILICFALYNTDQIFKDTSKEHTPFNTKHIFRIKKIAITIILIGICTNLMDGYINYLTTSQYTLNINVGTFVIGLIVFCLALFFEYGCELQRQSDETL